MTDVAQNANLLISQYRESEEFDTLIRRILDVAQSELVYPIPTIEREGILDLANGQWLDWIGIRLGLPRPYRIATGEKFFGFRQSSGMLPAHIVGFAEPGHNENEGTFEGPLEILDRVPISDDYYRSLLRGQAFRLTRGRSIADYDRFLARVFDGGGWASEEVRLPYGSRIASMEFDLGSETVNKREGGIFVDEETDTLYKVDPDDRVIRAWNLDTQTRQTSADIQSSSLAAANDYPSDIYMLRPETTGVARRWYVLNANRGASATDAIFVYDENAAGLWTRNTSLEWTLAPHPNIVDDHGVNRTFTRAHGLWVDEEEGVAWITFQDASAAVRYALPPAEWVPDPGHPRAAGYFPEIVGSPTRPRDVYVSPGTGSDRIMYMSPQWPRNQYGRTVYAYPLSTYDPSIPSADNIDDDLSFSWDPAAAGTLPNTTGLQGIDSGTRILTSVVETTTTNVQVRAFATGYLNRVTCHVIESRPSFIDIIRRIDYIPSPAGVELRIVEESA